MGGGGGEEGRRGGGGGEGKGGREGGNTLQEVPGERQSIRHFFCLLSFPIVQTCRIYVT